LVRYQQRYFRQIEENDWDVSNRTRLKAEAYFCLNGPNLFTNNLWYLALDYEEFIVLDQQLDERYAFRRRAKIGLNYRWTTSTDLMRALLFNLREMRSTENSYLMTM
jgi:hypothetical protein